MNLPKFLLGDNTDHPEDVFIIHTEYPLCIINLKDDEVEWLEDLSKEKEEDLVSETSTLIEQASQFYDREMERYEE